MGFFFKNRINVYEEKTYILHLAAYENAYSKDDIEVHV